MKVGVLTLHGSINPGAFWQCFSTCQVLRRLGHDPVVLDYRNPDLHPRSAFAPALSFRNWRRPHRLLWFFGVRMKTNRVLRLLPLGHPLDASFEQELPLDAILVGSDVVWREPADPVYFGQVFRCRKLIAYAASAGDTSASSRKTPRFLLSPSPFSVISCRDSNTLSFLAKGHPSWSDQAGLVNDPTITLSVPKPFLRPIRKKPYCMIYCSRNPSSKALSEFKRFAAGGNLDLLSVFYPHRNLKNISLVDAGIWMRLLLNASLVITDAFHGAVIARLHGVPIVYMNTTRDLPQKVRDQFQTLNLLNCVCQDIERFNETVTAARHVPPIETIRPKLANANIAFLQKSLSSSR